MHNNYYFLKRLTPVIATKISDAQVSACFTQNKNELILTFSNGFIIKAYLDSGFCCLSFPTTFHRARKNSMDLFEELQNIKVQGVRQFKNERCFSIDFDTGYRLLFKMHGNRSNIILCRKGAVLKIFKNSLKNDFKLSIDSLDREIDQTFENLKSQNGNFTKLFPTFGLILKQHLNNQNYSDQKIEKQWEILEKTIEPLNNGGFSICRIGELTCFSLVPTGRVLEMHNDPVEAINAFFNYKIQKEAFEKEKRQKLKAISDQLNKVKSYIASNTKKLNSLRDSMDYAKIADILMANLHQIPENVSSVELQNFYSQNEKITIKLNKKLSPQKNAENYYRKSKKQSTQTSILKENIEIKKVSQNKLLEQSESINCAQSLKELRGVAKSVSTLVKKNISKPYSEHTYMGYRILIGKSAKANDTILRSHTQKNDLWLHAKDVSGSHVIIKEIPGSSFPKPVLERAAELAAFHSKKRNETTCPVIYTPRKFVRKRKGDRSGAVIVEKEKVILVEPRGLSK